MAARAGILLFPFSFSSFLADFKHRKLNLPTLNKVEIRSKVTSHSAYVATETELVGAKIDGLLPPNFL